MPATIEKMPLVASTNLLGSGAIKLLLAMGDVTIAVLSQRPRVCKKTISEFYVTILKIFNILATTTFIIRKQDWVTYLSKKDKTSFICMTIGFFMAVFAHEPIAS